MSPKNRFLLLSLMMLGSVVFAPVAHAQIPGPTPEHAKLKAMVGKWKAVVKTLMDRNGQRPTTAN